MSPLMKMVGPGGPGGPSLPEIHRMILGCLWSHSLAVCRFGAYINANKENLTQAPNLQLY